MSGESKLPSKQHSYTALVQWTGNRGDGTRSYRAYDRTWDITTPGKPVISCSNDPLLGGDTSLPNPEDLLLCSVSACHMLWFLHLASNAKIVVTAYTDEPVAIGEVASNGAGRFVSATLQPSITLEAGSDEQKADAIHRDVHNYCFIARSLNFPIDIKASYQS